LPNGLPEATCRTRAGLLVALLAGALIAMLASCGTPAATPPPVPIGPTATVTVPIEMPTVISVVGSFDGQTLKVLEGQIAAFEAANADLRVELVKASADDEERRQAFAGYLAQGDTSRDIYLVDSTWLAGFAAEGWLLPLDDYLQAEGLAPDLFLPPAIQANTIDGRLLALPWTTDAGLLYYRQDLIDAVPQTWPGLAATASQVTGPEGTPYGFIWQGAAYETLTCSTLEFVWACGGQVLGALEQAAFDSPETRAALEQMAGLVRDGLAPAEVATYREAEALDAFARGEAAMMRHWFHAWDRLNAPGAPLAGKVAIAPLPVPCLGGQSLALSTSSLYPAQAFRFMAFLAGHEQQVELGREGSQPPARVSAYGDEALLEARPILRSFHNAVVLARPRPQSASYPAISEAIYIQVNALLRGEQDVAATAAAAQAQIEALLDKP
jgi:multiple sugar transport system substrate-binding protein